MIKLEFPKNMIETTLNMQGVVVSIRKCDEDLYEININDNGILHRENLPIKYLNDYIKDECNYLINEYKENLYWCIGLYNVLHTGNIHNGDKFKIEHINIILQAIENGLIELERLKTPEIIKVGNVTITRQIVACGKVKISIDGLIEGCKYPDAVYYGDSGVAFKVTNCDVFVLHDKNKHTIRINEQPHLPIKDLILTKEECDKVIEIITESELALVEYNRIKVGDKVTYRDHGYNLECTVLDIEGDFACVKTYCGVVTGYNYDKIRVAALKKVQNE